MHIVPGFLLREVARETLAVPTCEAARKLSGLMSLNSSGQFLVELLQKDWSEQELLEAFLDAYDVDEDTARRDIREFLNCLIEDNLIVPSNGECLSAGKDE